MNPNEAGRAGQGEEFVRPPALAKSSRSEANRPRCLQKRGFMETQLKEPESQSFVETALKMGGKSEEEARTTGTIDRADDQVDALFAARYQTANSPVHRAVWDRKLPAELFLPQPSVTPPKCERTMQQSLETVAATARREPCTGRTARSRRPSSTT